MNTFGRYFRVTTFGESHGRALGGVVDGCPPGLSLSEAYVQEALDRRRPGQGKLTSAREESDTIEILSGVYEGKTTGTPIGFIIRNRDQRPEDYDSLRDIYRPGHADFTYEAKYGIRDHRGSGRASGRETVARVAAGAIAAKLLEEYGIFVISFTKSIGKIQAEMQGIIPTENVPFSRREQLLQAVESSPVRCPDHKAGKKMEEYVESVKAEGDSVGGIVETLVYNLPAGLGEPVFDKVTALLGQGILSIGAVKGIEFGDGFALAEMHGSEANDAFIFKEGEIQTASNHAGGLLGGITTGMPLIFRTAVKPTSSIGKKQQTVSKNGKPVELSIRGRHDPCIVIRIVPVVEAMTNLVMADLILAAGKLKR